MLRVVAYLSMFLTYEYFYFLSCVQIALPHFNLTLTIGLVPMFRDVKPNEA